MSKTPGLDALASAMRGKRLRATTEEELQRGLARVLTDACVEHRRHEPLSADDIPDFMVGGAAIELKVDGSLASVTRQLHRYAQHAAVTEIVLVTTKARHRPMPASMNGKPVSVFWLEGWL
jgi:hypothetical protein